MARRLWGGNENAWVSPASRSATRRGCPACRGCWWSTPRAPAALGLV